MTTYYYVGFAYMMMRRYEDAIRSFVNVLLYVQRAKQVIQTKSYQFEEVRYFMLPHAFEQFRVSCPVFARNCLDLPTCFAFFSQWQQTSSQTQNKVIEKSKVRKKYCMKLKHRTNYFVNK